MKYSIPTPPTSPAYHLTDKTIIGRGNKRDCHAHPDDPRLCIKVARHADRWHECQQQSIVEWYYLNHLKQRQVPLEHLADCHGWVNTNHGAGLVVERVRDDNNNAGVTLYDALNNRRIEARQAHRMLKSLGHWVITHSVVVADLNSTNIMVRKHHGENQLVFVDGVGSRKPEWKFTLYLRSPLFARLKTYRQWQRQGGRLAQVIDKLAG